MFSRIDDLFVMIHTVFFVHIPKKHNVFDKGMVVVFVSWRV